jgi:hypothetical protein
MFTWFSFTHCSIASILLNRGDLIENGKAIDMSCSRYDVNFRIFTDYNKCGYYPEAACYYF